MFLLCLFSFFFSKILKCTCLCSVLVTKFSYKHVWKISQPIYALLQRNLGVGNEVFFIHVWNISVPIYPLSQVLLFISSYLENFGCWWRSFLYTCLCFRRIDGCYWSSFLHTYQLAQWKEKYMCCVIIISRRLGNFQFLA